MALAFFGCVPVLQAQEPTLKELELQQENLKLRQTIAQMQTDYGNLLAEFGGREAARLKPAIEGIQQEIEKKKKENK